VVNILDPSALLTKLPSLLPESKRLESPQDALAALVHTVLSSLDFRLIGIDDSANGNTYADNILPEGWNRHGPETYLFKYRHNQSSLDFLLKVVKLGTMMQINGIASETRSIANLSVVTNDFLSPSFFPHTIESGSEPLVHGFIASNRVSDFVSQLSVTIVQNLVPGLRKDGYSEESSGAQSTASGSRPPQQSGQREPPPAAYPRPPPVQPHAPFSPPSHIPPDSPLRIPEIGRRDREPLFNDPAQNPFAPPPLFPPGVGDGDGMFVGPNHPIFQPGRSGGGYRGGQSPFGPWGGDGFLPPMGAPPGARFDPVVPGPRGPFGGGGFPANPRPGFGRNGGDPDNDEFMPPGADDMYM